MPATLFLSPLSTLPNTAHLLPSHAQFSISSSLNPKPPQNPTPSKTPHSTPPLESFSSSDASVKAPAAPWMKGPLLLQPHQVIDFSKPRNRKIPGNAKPENSDSELGGKLVGIRGERAIKQIVQSIERLGPNENPEKPQEGFGEFGIWDCLEGLVQEDNSVGTHRGFGEFGIGDCLEGLGKANDSRISGKKMPWEREERMVFPRVKRERVASAAELSLEKELLERLRGEAAKLRKWIKVKKAGVTQAVVDDVKFIWKGNELAMLKFDVPLCQNMYRAQEILEMKTGGMVVWRNKDSLVIYRGCNYQSTSKFFPKRHPRSAGCQETSSSDLIQLDLEKSSIYQSETFESAVDEKLNKKNDKEDPTQIFLETNVSCQPTSRSLYEKEADRLLDGLGPRFIDWWMHKPLPVDADLLPEVVPGFKAPIRRCPPNTRSRLTDDELTNLRKSARSLPTHFVLGRNRKLQGLAAAILKLWEKSQIAKIAVKFGVPNTNNEQMAYELKCLTGGVLLLRNKFIILLYRGKDFLPCGVSDLVAKREIELNRWQLHEEHARLKAIETFSEDDEPLGSTGTVGTLSEFHNIQTEYGDLIRRNKDIEIKLEAEKARLGRELRNQEHKAFILNRKIEKSTNKLSKLNYQWTPAEQDVDQEMMTEEERECFRKIGLQMHSCLVLGRRGVFNGVKEGIHQHWKHREVVKVITMQKLFGQVMYTAKLLEAESGGVLVSVDKLKKGHAIIIYRGRNYRRPFKPICGNLLSKRKALHRSLEMQRIGSLKFFASQRQQAALDLKLKLEKPRMALEEFPRIEAYLPALV
ncbi:hypothetical protein TB2_046978 [Malus domestica]|nr:chloroplastic group IIA intron splicing facilitator CRS1, chloroplastic isoform X1 [Malus domestica]